jgi:uncharacterized membrane protein YoaK (UPF0700 family)
MTLRAPAHRTFSDDLKLGIMTAFSAGMVNVAALILFFAFTSNVTGHFAILAEEISNGKWYQVFIVFLWILLFFAGSFLSNSIIINLQDRLQRWARAIPLLIEIACLVIVGIYGQYHYKETLMETELLVAVLLFSMGLQNGLTATISNFAVKTTHLTGLTTDLAIHLSMATRAEWRNKPEVRNKIVLMTCIALSYLIGGILAGSITGLFQFRVFFWIASVLLFTLAYDAIRYPASSEGEVRSAPTATAKAGTHKDDRQAQGRRTLEPSYSS